MNLFTILAHLPHEQLRRLAHEFGITAASPSKRTLLDALTLKYRDPCFLSNLMNELPSPSRGLLRFLVFFSEAQSEIFLFPDTLPSVEPSGKLLADHLTPLLESGLLFLDQTGPERQVLFPAEVRRALRPLFSAPFGSLRPCEERSVDSVPPRIPALEGIFHWLSLLRRRKIRLTRKGAVPRTILDQWLERQGYPAGREEHFEFVLNYGLSRGLILSAHGIYRLSPSAEEWFARGESQMHRDVWEYFRGTMLPLETGIQTVLTALYAAEDWVRRHQTLPVFLVEDLVQALGAQARPGGEAPSRERITTWLRWLEFLGLVHLGNRQTAPALTLTRTAARILFEVELPSPAAASSPCILQPNFDLLVPPLAGYRILWQLEQMAEFRRRDVLTEYHLSRRSVLSAMRRGWSRAEVLDFLEELTGGGLPGNVRYTLGEWCGHYGRIRLRRTVLVECAGADLAEELEHVPDVKSILGERIADRFFAVPETRARELIRLLRERGYEPSPAQPASPGRQSSESMNNEAV